MIYSRCFLHDMKNAVPAFRFRFSRIDDALILLVESCRNVDGCVSLVLIALYTAVVSAENNLAFVTTSVCRRTTREVEERKDTLPPGKIPGLQNGYSPIRN